MEKVLPKPWGNEVIIELNDHYCVKLLNVRKGERLSLQYHQEKHETLIVKEGYGKIKIGGEVHAAVADKVFVIRPKKVHRIEAHPHSDLVILEVSTPQLDDVIRLEDDYRR